MFHHEKHVFRIHETCISELRMAGLIIISETSYSIRLTVNSRKWYASHCVRNTCID
jgi:hypothetical protein